jgi:hypothetical protein
MTYLDQTQGARREGSSGHVGTADIAAGSVTSAKMAEDLLRTVQVALSSANILAMNGAPVSLIAAPGAGKVIVVDHILLKMVTTATGYANGGAVEFRYTDGSGAKVTADIAAAVITAGAGTSYTAVRGVVTSLTPVANAAVVVTNATAAFITGTGAGVLTIKYRIVTP